MADRVPHAPDPSGAGHVAKAGHVMVRRVPAAARFVFRGRHQTVDTAGAAFGVALPRMPMRSASSGERHALWLGPDEWLLLAPPGDADPIAEAFGGPLADLCSLVDVSHRNAGFLVEGPGAEAALNGGCPLDLDLTACPVGMCTRTIFHKVEIILWRTAPDAFQVEVWRSFADYVIACLTEVSWD